MWRGLLGDWIRGVSGRRGWVDGNRADFGEICIQFWRIEIGTRIMKNNEKHNVTTTCGLEGKDRQSDQSVSNLANRKQNMISTEVGLSFTSNMKPCDILRNAYF